MKLARRILGLALLLCSACAVETEEEIEQSTSNLDADDEGENEDFDDDANDALTAPDDGDASVRPLAPMPRVAAYFTYPTGTAPDKRAESLENQVIAMAQHAKAGSKVRLVIFHLTRVRVANAFIKAADNGADVRIIVGAGGTPAVKKLKDRLGNRVTICQHGRGSCIGTGINHDKLMLFSALDNGATNVVAQASQNFTNSQRHLHNNMVVAQDASLYAGYSKYFDDLVAQKQDPSYDRTAEGAGLKAFMFPRSDDTVSEILDNVSCGGGGELRVAMALFVNRKGVARRLAQRAKEGCKVHVVVRPKGHGTGSQVMSILRSAGPNLEVAVIPKGPGGNHSKYLLVDAKFKGTRQKLIFTGSHNYTRGAWKNNDEVLLRVDDVSVYPYFLFDWYVIRSKAS
jgi:hypothetical protein